MKDRWTPPGAQRAARAVSPVAAPGRTLRAGRLERAAQTKLTACSRASAARAARCTLEPPRSDTFYSASAPSTKQQISPSPYCCCCCSTKRAAAARGERRARAARSRERAGPRSLDAEARRVPAFSASGAGRALRTGAAYSGRRGRGGGPLALGRRSRAGAGPQVQWRP